jgi:hypothetical protein
VIIPLGVLPSPSMFQPCRHPSSPHFASTDGATITTIHTGMGLQEMANKIARRLGPWGLLRKKSTTLAPAPPLSLSQRTEKRQDRPSFGGQQGFPRGHRQTIIIRGPRDDDHQGAGRGRSRPTRPIAASLLPWALQGWCVAL